MLVSQWPNAMVKMMLWWCMILFHLCKWCKAKGKKVGVNFGVLQLHLFNHLKPEGANCVSFSSVQDRRGLNTKMSKNFPIEKELYWNVQKINLLVWYVGDWLKYSAGEINQLQKECLMCMMYVMYVCLFMMRMQCKLLGNKVRIFWWKVNFNPSVSTLENLQWKTSYYLCCWGKPNWLWTSIWLCLGEEKKLDLMGSFSII